MSSSEKVPLWRDVKIFFLFSLDLRTRVVEEAISGTSRVVGPPHLTALENED
jgi:hypothetical protein